MDDKIYAKVLRFLTIRPRSEKEVTDYLTKKKINDAESLLILDRLKKQKFLDDKAFAVWYIKSRKTFKPKGERLIRFELKQKGITKEIIDTVLQNFQESLPTDEENAKEILFRKKKKYEGLSRNERFQKAGSMLARRGYDLDTIKQVIDEVFGK
ncbi:MAG: regulatory protein RecX [Candidatus Levyibacteriota bacterium]